VRKIRRALNDDAESSRCIVTIPGKSYRFVEPVRIPNGEATTNGNGKEAINRQSAALTSASDESQPRRHNHWLALISVAGLALVAAAMAVVAHLSRGTSTTSASNILAELPAPQLPNKPSIAVLPFANLSGDPQQEYFSDGITDELITDLSRLPNLFGHCPPIELRL
jgi:hypothetical protein